MSNQPEQENQQPETVTPEELRPQAIAEFSDEQLVEVTAGRWVQHAISGIKATWKAERDTGRSPLMSATSAIVNGIGDGIKLGHKGITDPEVMRKIIRNSIFDTMARYGAYL